MTFSEALDTYADILPDIRDTIAENLTYDLKQLVRPPLTGDVDLDWVREQVYLRKVKETMELRMSYLKRIEQRLAAKTVRQAMRAVTPDMIARAKEYPIADIYPEKVRSGMSRCIFHDDKTASMSLRRYNRYRCFGCDARGSVIDLYMKINECTFPTAVTWLSTH